MNIRFLHGTALIAGLGAAIGLAGCKNGTSTPGTTTSITPTSTGSTSDVLAKVGGSSITRGDLDNLLEAQYGPSGVSVLIGNQLVLEEGKAKGVVIPDSEVQADLDRRIADQSPKVAAQFKTPGPKLDYVKLQIKRELTVQGILTRDIKATDAQAEAFFTKYKSFYEKSEQLKVGVLATSTKTRADAMSRALASKGKTFEQLVAEQKASPADIAGQNSVATQDEFASIESFGPIIKPILLKTPKGGATAPIALPGSQTPLFLIFKVVDIKSNPKPDFKTLKSTVLMDYKLAQVAMKEVTLNKANPAQFEQNLTRQKAQLISENPVPGYAPSMREILASITVYPSRRMIDGLQRNGTVQISDPTYTDLAEEYKPIPTPAAPAGAVPAPGAMAPAPGAAPGAAPALGDAAPGAVPAPAAPAAPTPAAP